MIPKKTEKTKRGVTLVCRKCGKKVNSYAKDYSIRERVKKRPEDEIIVMENDISMETLPVTTAQCPKCGHTKAHWWVLQTRSVDEGPTKFYQCCKCKHRWREYQ